MAGNNFEETTFICQITGEVLNVCYADNLVFFTFYDKNGQCYRKGVYDATVSRETIRSIIEDFTEN